MIRKVSFRNFKAYRSLDLELEPFTVLVGPNASGKTTLLEGLDLTARHAQVLAGLGANVKVQSPSSVQSFGASTPPELAITGTWEGTAGTVRLREAIRRFIPVQDLKKNGTPSTPDNSIPGKTRSDWSIPITERHAFSVTGEWGGVAFPSEGTQSLGANDRVFQTQLSKFRSALGATAVLRFESRRLGEASYSEDVVPKVHSDGSGLASVLAYLKLSQDEVFSEIELALKRVVPTVRRIRIERAPVEQTVVRTISLDNQSHEVPEKRTLWGNQVVLDMRGAKGVPASAAGEGTIMALGLLAVLMGPERPKLILLDDIEMALHPAAQEQLIGVLRKIQERDPELQIVATSHSPFILNYLKPEEIRITSLAENGAARCVPMTSHPDFERWKDIMSPGEFWSTVGESWIHKPEDTSAQGEPATHE